MLIQVEFNKAAQSLTEAIIPPTQKRTALNRFVKVLLRCYTPQMIIRELLFTSLIPMIVMS